MISFQNSYGYSIFRFTGIYAVFKADIHNDNNMFGSSIYYIAEIMNNMVFSGSVYSFSTRGTMYPVAWFNFTSGSFTKPNTILSGQTIRIADKVYQIYASMFCGTQNDLVNVFAFEHGSVNKFYDYQFYQNQWWYQQFDYNAGSYLFLQLGYVTLATCDHQKYIYDVAVNFMYVALQGDKLILILDTMNSLQSILSCFPSKIDTTINNQVNNPYLFYGGTSNQYIQYADGNKWLNTQGNIIGDQSNFVYTYSNDSIFNRPTNQGRYFTHHSSGTCSFVSVLDSGQVARTDFFKVGFNVGYSGKENVLCHTDNGTFLVNQVTYTYQWQIIYNACGNQITSAPWVNSVIILQQNNVTGDSIPLFEQNFSSTCPTTNSNSPEYISQQVNGTNQRIHYIMYTNNCSTGYTPPSPPTTPLQIAQAFIQSITCWYTCQSCTKISASSCQTCPLYAFRVLSNNQCLCQSGYYDDGQDTLCQACSYTCATCIAGTAYNCTSCPVNSNRTLTSNSCPCNSGYFNDGQNSPCAQCSYTCATCTAYTSQSCQNCTANSFRTQSNTSCPCNYGYFDNGSAMCAACSYTCATCSVAKTSCSACPKNASRTQNNNSCPCNDGFYDNGSTKCLECSYTCANCSSNTTTSCLNCESKSFRVFKNGSCPCQIGYFDNNISATCVLNNIILIAPCSYTCATCTAATSSSCLSCHPNTFRIFHNMTCLCQDGYYENYNHTAICEKCHFSCQTCSDASTTCISCNSSNYRQLLGLTPNLCICQLGYQDDGMSTCVISFQSNSLAQIKPICIIKNCQQCWGNVCQSCKQGYFLHQNYCLNCDQRCLGCFGTETNQCLQCAFIQDHGQCKICEEIKGLYTVGNKCESVCGDGIVYIEKEECDDGNLKDDDGCNSLCLIVPIRVQTTLTIDMNQNLFTNIRTAIMTLDKNCTQDFSLWQITIPGLKKDLYGVTYVFDKNQLYITLELNSSLVNNILQVIPDKNSFTVDQQMQASLPDYQIVSQSEKNQTQTSLDVNAIMVNLIAIILGICLLTGGFNMVQDILDLFQTLSYLKYCNVQFPYNAQTYLDYMGNFNFNSITQYIPYVYECSTNILGDYKQQSDTIAPQKMQDDGYSTLFLFNFICIISAWMGSLAIYIACTIGLKITRKFNNLDNLDSYRGFKQKIYIFLFKFNQYLIACLRPFNESFFYSGILRIFISTNYDMNFAIFLELRNLHLSNESSVLTFSSLAAISIFILQILIIKKVSSIMQRNTRKQLTKQDLMNKIGSMTEGLQKNYSIFIKYFKVIMLVKKILVMFALVCLYDHPIYQIGFISCLHLNLLFIYIYYAPLEEREEYIKCVTNEAFVFLVVLVIHIFSFDQELNFLNQQNQTFLGWIIIGLCSSTIAIQIILDIKIQFRFIFAIFQKFRIIFKHRASIGQANREKIQNKQLDISKEDIIDL